MTHLQFDFYKLQKLRKLHAISVDENQPRYSRQIDTRNKKDLCFLSSTGSAVMKTTSSNAPAIAKIATFGDQPPSELATALDALESLLN